MFNWAEWRIKLPGPFLSLYHSLQSYLPSTRLPFLFTRKARTIMTKWNVILSARWPLRRGWAGWLYCPTCTLLTLYNVYLCVHVWNSVSTWDLEEKMVSNRVAGSSLLDDETGQEVVVVDRNGSVIVHYQRWSFVWDLLHAIDFIAWNTGQRTQSIHVTPLKPLFRLLKSLKH